ncbi:MAG: hypothetical protein Q7J26_13840 [Brevundimonas sp.]|nr:hypothetical protein [Brevundimonas sp.]MDO9609600.1 hypothetical protein [Brevundimonas sp.]
MRLALIAAVATALSTAPAVAQTWYGAPTRYDHPRDRAYQGRDAYRPYGRNQTYGSGALYDFKGQADRPGDYRCDAYWDAARTDCGAAWRDQRPAYARRYRSAGYGYSYSSGPGVYPAPMAVRILSIPAGARPMAMIAQPMAATPAGWIGVAAPTAPTTRPAAIIAPMTDDWSSAADRPLTKMRPR